MDHLSPRESEHHKTELIQRLRDGLSDNIDIEWDKTQNNLIFKAKQTGKTILTAQYNLPPYPMNTDADTLIDQVKSRLEKSDSVQR